jgi:hypothetical protein
MLHLLAPYISRTPPMAEERARALTGDDLGALPLRDRWALFRLWTTLARRRLIAVIQTSQREYGECVRQLGELQSLGDVEVMRKAKV